MRATTETLLGGRHILRCVHCGTEQRAADPLFQCEQCQELLEARYPEWIPLKPRETQQLKRTWRERRMSNAPEDVSGVWRYRELLPAIAPQHIVTLKEGNTPVWPLRQASRRLGLENLRVKHQGMNPSGSFKDTGMSVALSMARVEGFEVVCCASTGNTSASMAAYAAHAGMKSIVLLPAGYVTAGKLAQALEFGSTVLQLRTDFDGCLRLLYDVVRRFRAYLLNSVNPWRLEGQKTLAFELLDQLDWQAPDHVIVPGGNLGNSSALGKGMIELLELGIIDRLPKISIIQAAGANPLVRTMRENGGRELIPVEAETRATAIRIGNPASWRKAVAVLRRTGGACEDVTEDEIRLAKSELGAEGIGCEPASATTLAGLKKLVRSGFVKADESVVLILTGNMLKDADYMRQDDKQQLIGPMEADAATVIRALEKLYAAN